MPVVLYCSLQDPQYIHSVVNALTHNIGRTSVKCTTCHRLISIPCLGERDSLGVLGKYSTSAGVDLSCDRVGARDNQAGTRLLWGHITVTPPLWELLPFQLLLSTGEGKTLSTDTQGVTASPAPLPTRESRSLDKWVRDIVRGLVLPSGDKTNQPHILYITLNVIVYNLLIPWWWCPCMEYLVFGFLKTAWNKMYNSQSYLCFCNCCDKSTL